MPQLTFFRSVDGDLGPCDGAGLLRRHRERAWLAGALHYFPVAMVELAPAPVVLGLSGMELTFPAAAHIVLFSALVQNHRIIESLRLEETFKITGPTITLLLA